MMQNMIWAIGYLFVKYQKYSCQFQNIGILEDRPIKSSLYVGLLSNVFTVAISVGRQQNICNKVHS